jgi:hypothetical protein
MVDEYRRRAHERARQYTWDGVTDSYEQLLEGACRMHGPGALPEELVDVGAPPPVAARTAP